LEWNLETIGKLVLAVLVLLFVFFLTIQLTSLFISDPTGFYNAKHNAQLLFDRIEYVQDNKLTGPEASVIINVPPTFILVGFNPGASAITFAETGASMGSNPLIDRPGDCDKDKTCICIMQGSIDDSRGTANTKFVTKPVVCQTFTFKQVSGTLDTQMFSRTGTDQKMKLRSSSGGQYDFLISGVEDSANSKDVKILIHGDTLVLDASAPKVP
jgi:hypothetical protein